MIKQMNLRLHEDLLAQIVAAAKESGRSLNGEMNWRLQQYQIRAEVRAVVEATVEQTAEAFSVALVPKLDLLEMQIDLLARVTNPSKGTHASGLPPR